MRFLILLLILPVLFSTISAQPYQKLLDKASKLEAKHKTLKQKKILDKAVKKYPDEAEIHYALAEYYLDRSNGEDFMEEITKAIELRPRGEYYWARGWVYLNWKKNCIRAKADLKKAIKLKVKTISSWVGMCECYVMERDVEKLRETAEKIKPAIHTPASDRIRERYEAFQIAINNIERERVDSAFLERLKSGIKPKEDDIRSSINYSLVESESVKKNKWERILTTLDNRVFINVDRTLKDLKTGQKILDLSLKDFDTFSSSRSNLLTEGNYSRGVTPYDLLTQKKLDYVSFPGNDCSMLEIIGKYAFTSYDYGKYTYLAKVDLISGAVIYKTLLEKGRRDVMAFHTDGENSKVITKNGKYLEINEAGKITKTKNWPGKLGKGLWRERTRFSEGGLFSVILINTNIYLVDNNGNILRQNQLNEQEWFLSKGKLKARRISIHPENHAAFIGTGYGIIVWHFLSNSFYLLDHINTASANRKNFVNTYNQTWSHVPITFYENGRKMLRVSKGKRWFYKMSSDTANPQLHQKFLEPSKNEYKGETKNGVPNGIGVMVFANNNRYEGEFKDGLPHGTGIMRYENGEGFMYEGKWKNGKRNGKGILYIARSSETGQSERYDCYWKNNKKHGPGYYIDYNWYGQRNKEGKNKVSYIFKGEWKEDVRHGKAEIYTTRRLDMQSDIHSRYIYEIQYDQGEVINKKLIAEDVWWKRWLYGEGHSENNTSENADYTVLQGSSNINVSRKYEKDENSLEVVNISISDGGIIFSNVCENSYSVTYHDSNGGSGTSINPFQDSSDDAGINEFSYPIDVSIQYKPTCNDKIVSVKVRFHNPGWYNIQLR